jgi:transcriptional regulator with XRE-family HTH domain
VISGHVVKVIRESLDLSQEQLAEHLAVDPNTVQSWESGRRGLPSTRVTTLGELQRRLYLLGADRPVVSAITTAIEADYLLSYVLETPAAAVVDLSAHPLAASVLRRDVIDLLAWPFTGRAPVVLPRSPRARHGPTPSAPGVPRADREAFFAHLREIVERSCRAWPDSADPQPHRQIYYLMQWDRRPDMLRWVHDVEQRERRAWRPAIGWTPRWVAARSAAITQARQGDPEPLRAFIATGLEGQEECEDADLNYWAYWLDETTVTWRSDDAMTGGLHRWAGHELLERFTSRLTPQEPLLDLYAHSTCALITRRPHLLEAPLAAARLGAGVEHVLEGGGLVASTRRRLEDLRFAVKLSRR